MGIGKRQEGKDSGFGDSRGMGRGPMSTSPTQHSVYLGGPGARVRACGWLEQSVQREWDGGVWAGH